MRDNVNHAGCQLVFGAHAHGEGPAVHVGAQVAHAHAGIHVLVELAGALGIAQVGHQGEVVARPARIGAHTPEVHVVFGPGQVAAVGFGVAAAHTEGHARADGVVKGVVRAKGCAAEVALVAIVQAAGVHVPAALVLPQGRKPERKADVVAIGKLAAGIHGFGAVDGAGQAQAVDHRRGGSVGSQPGHLRHRTGKGHARSAFDGPGGLARAGHIVASGRARQEAHARVSSVHVVEGVVPHIGHGRVQLMGQAGQHVAGRVDRTGNDDVAGCVRTDRAVQHAVGVFHPGVTEINSATGAICHGKAFKDVDIFLGGVDDLQGGAVRKDGVLERRVLRKVGRCRDGSFALQLAGIHNEQGAVAKVRARIHLSAVECAAVGHAAGRYDLNAISQGNGRTHSQHGGVGGRYARVVDALEQIGVCHTADIGHGACAHKQVAAHGVRNVADVQRGFFGKDVSAARVQGADCELGVVDGSQRARILHHGFHGGGAAVYSDVTAVIDVVGFSGGRVAAQGVGAGKGDAAGVGDGAALAKAAVFRCGAVAREGAVRNGDCAIGTVPQGSAIAGRVAVKNGIADGHSPVQRSISGRVGNGTAHAAAGRIAREGAAGDGDRAVKVIDGTCLGAFVTFKRHASNIERRAGGVVDGPGGGTRGVVCEAAACHCHIAGVPYRTAELGIVAAEGGSICNVQAAFIVECAAIGGSSFNLVAVKGAVGEGDGGRASLISCFSPDGQSTACCCCAFGSVVGECHPVQRDGHIRRFIASLDIQRTTTGSAVIEGFCRITGKRGLFDCEFGRLALPLAARHIKGPTECEVCFGRVVGEFCVAQRATGAEQRDAATHGEIAR